MTNPSVIETKINAINAQITNPELSVQAVTSLSKYRDYLLTQLNPKSKPAAKQFVLPVAIGTGVALIILAGVSFFSSPAPVVESASSNDSVEEVTTPAASSFELISDYASQDAFSEYLLYSYERTGTIDEVTAFNYLESGLSFVQEEHYQSAAQAIQDSLASGKSIEHAAEDGAAKLREEIAHFSPLTFPFIARGILIHHGLAQPEDFSW